MVNVNVFFLHLDIQYQEVWVLNVVTFYTYCEKNEATAVTICNHVYTNVKL
jgi:hypothetical protein